MSAKRIALFKARKSFQHFSSSVSNLRLSWLSRWFAFLLVALAVLSGFAAAFSVVNVTAGRVYEVNLSSEFAPTRWFGLYGVAGPNGSFSFNTSLIPAPGVSALNASFIDGCVENDSTLFALHERYISWSNVSAATLENIDGDNGVRSGSEQAKHIFTSSASFSFGNQSFNALVARPYSEEPGVVFETFALHDDIFNHSFFATRVKPTPVKGFDGSLVNYQFLLPKISGNTTFFFTRDPRLCNLTNDSSRVSSTVVQQKIFEVYSHALVYSNDSTSTIVYEINPPSELSSNLTVFINSSLEDLEMGKISVNAYILNSSDPGKHVPLTLVDIADDETRGLTMKWRGNFKPSDMVKIQIQFKNRIVSPDEVKALVMPDFETTRDVQLVNLVLEYTQGARQALNDLWMIILLVVLLSAAAFALFSKKHYWLNNLLSKNRTPYAGAYIRNNLKDSLSDVRYAVKRKKK